MDGDILDQIEKSNDTVDTTQLLDLLERETHSGGPLSSSVVRPNTASTVTDNDVATSDDDIITLDEQFMNDGQSKKRSRQRRRRGNRSSGYSSGDSHDSSFTSTLLGGNALLNMLEDDLEVTKSSESAPSINVNSYYAPSSSNSNSNVDNSDRSGADSQKNVLKQTSQQRSPTSNPQSVTPQKNGGINYNSDSNNTSTNKYTRQEFDNPFGVRRRSSNLSLFSSSNDLLQNANNNTAANKLSASITKGKASSANIAKAVAPAEATTEAATVLSDDSGTDGGTKNSSSRHSVSFSIEESKNSKHTPTHSDTDADVEDDDDDDDSSQNNDNQQHYATDTFSLTGSLASLAISARSGSNRSRTSHNTRSTRSSRSSRSSHGSATTTSTHSSKSSQERRQRRELLPAVTNDDKKKSKKKGRKGNATDSVSRASSSRASTGSRASYSSRASASSVASNSTGTTSSLYRRNSKHKNKGKLFADLHHEHPTRYPKRSSIIQEEMGEDDLEDDGVGSVGMYYGSDLNSSCEDLFARSKSSNKSNEEGGDDFVGGLIASTTKKNGVTSRDKDDNASVGDATFLSDLFSGHVNVADDRAGAGPKQRKGGSVISGMSSVTFHTRVDDVKKDNDKSKSKKEYRRYDDDNDDDITMIASVRRSVQRASNWYEHGDPLPRTRQDCIKWCDDGGSILPQSKKEWVQWGVLALLLAPLIHVAVLYIISGSSSINEYYGGEIQFVSSDGVVVSARANLAGHDGREISSLTSLGASKTWAGSSMVMLSRRSSPRENFILIPDADWIELQISRNHASTNSDGRIKFFSWKHSKSQGISKPPQRLPLPSVLDPVGDSTSSLVLFSLTASNGNNVPTKGSDTSSLNTNANFNLWNAIQYRLIPEPVDAWPSWSHNSLAQYREDSFTLMYPYSKRREARSALVKLASEFGQSSFYEFTTWSEAPGSGDRFSSSEQEKAAMERAGSIRRIGEDGSAIIIPPLPDGRSDIMIRNTIIVDEKSAESRGGEYPSVVMRRVKDLPVEDELTMRDFEGPSVDEITWSKKMKVKAKNDR